MIDSCSTAQIYHRSIPNEFRVKFDSLITDHSFVLFDAYLWPDWSSQQTRCWSYANISSVHRAVRRLITSKQSQHGGTVGGNVTIITCITAVITFYYRSRYVRAAAKYNSLICIVYIRTFGLWIWLTSVLRKARVNCRLGNVVGIWLHGMFFQLVDN